MAIVGWQHHTRAILFLQLSFFAERKGVLRWAEAEPQVRVVLIFFLFLRRLPDFFDM